MFQTLIFFLLTNINFGFFVLKTPRNFFTENNNKSITLFFHLYFCIFASFILKDDDLIYCSYIYFIYDSILNSFYKTFKTFNKYHHLFAMVILLNNKYLEQNLINAAGILEVSTIVLCLIDLNLISKKTFDILFPSSFIFFRLVVFNFYVFDYLLKTTFDINIFNYIVILLLNIMNIGIVIKMKLVQKLFVMCF